MRLLSKYKILPTLIFWTVVWLIELFVVYLKTGSVHLSLSVCPGRAMRHLVFLLPALLLLLALPDTRGRYNDDFDDGEDIAEFDDNDFAEFEDVSEDPASRCGERAAPTSSPLIHTYRGRRRRGHSREWGRPGWVWRCWCTGKNVKALLFLFFLQVIVNLNLIWSMLQDQDMYSKYDNEELRAMRRPTLHSKTLLYTERYKFNEKCTLQALNWLP